jgi:hypothetical protein
MGEKTKRDNEKEDKIISSSKDNLRYQIQNPSDTTQQQKFKNNNDNKQ